MDARSGGSMEPEYEGSLGAHSGEERADGEGHRAWTTPARCGEPTTEQRKSRVFRRWVEVPGKPVLLQPASSRHPVESVCFAFKSLSEDLLFCFVLSPRTFYYKPITLFLNNIFLLKFFTSYIINKQYKQKSKQKAGHVFKNNNCCIPLQH